MISNPPTKVGKLSDALKCQAEQSPALVYAYDIVAPSIPAGRCPKC